MSEEEWYHHQLLQLRVVTEGGVQLGVISEVLERPANDVWVATAEDRETLIPATKEAVLKVDLEAGEVVIADWLLTPP